MHSSYPPAKGHSVIHAASDGARRTGRFAQQFGQKEWIALAARGQRAHVLGRRLLVELGKDG